MNKSTIIATSLVNVGFADNLESANRILESEIHYHFPDLSFEDWNTDVPEAQAAKLIEIVSARSSISIVNFVHELADY